jgi:hypothetical protein
MEIAVFLQKSVTAEKCECVSSIQLIKLAFYGIRAPRIDRRQLAANSGPCHCLPPWLDLTLDSFLSSLLDSATAVWAEFLDIAPVVLLGIGHWLYEWQVLLAGICALVAARSWGRAVVKAAQMRTVATDVPDKILPPRRNINRAPPRPLDLRANDAEPSAVRPLDTLQVLRSRIRAVLCKVPCSDDPLSQAQIAFCRAVGTFALGEMPLKNDAMAQEYASLQSELTALNALDTSASCKMAWQTLITINKCARSLETMLGAAPTPASNGGNVAQFRR